MSNSKTMGENKDDDRHLCTLRAPPSPPDVCWSSRTVNRPFFFFFTNRLGICFSLETIQCPEGGSLPRTISPLIPWSPEMYALPLHTRARWWISVPCCGLWASAKAVGELRARMYQLALVRQWRYFYFKCVAI